MAALELWAEVHAGLTVAVVLDNRRLIDLEIDNDVLRPTAGEVLSARITSLQPRSRSAEVDLGAAGLAFLDLGKATFNAGDVVQVEWLNPAHDGKLQTVRLHTGAVPARLDAMDRLLARHRFTFARVNDKALEARLSTAGVAVTLVPEPFDLYDIHTQLRALVSREVELPQGGSLVIDQLEALTVIDVNGGRAGTGVNALALPEIARQLRLRNLGGIIIADMVGGRDDKLVTELRRLTAEDPCRVEVFGITRLGLLEMTRQRRGYPLAQALGGFVIS